MRRPRDVDSWYEYEKVKNFRDSEVFLKNIDTTGQIKFALIYPNDYQIASSSLSFHKVFEKLNESRNIGCERFFYDNKFKKNYSIDSLTPLDQFSIWSFSVNFELDIINIIKLLKSYKIPLNKKNRKSYHPIIIVGGALSYFRNAITDVIADFIYHGDLSDEFIKYIEENYVGKPKDSFIKDLNIFFRFKGVNFSCSLSNSVYLTKKTVFDNRFLIEISRGCKRKCKFCTVGFNFGNFRHIDPELIIMKMKEVKKFTKKIGLVSATVTDYPFLDKIIKFSFENDYDLSFSSLRLDSLTENILKILKKSSQNQFTIAPEGGSQKIRNIYSKGITNDHITRALKLGRDMLFDSIKLYFIYGAPEEEKNDLDEIVNIGKCCLDMGYKKIIFSVNPLIPKPDTPFENLQMENIKVLKSKEKYLKNELKKTGIKGNFESIKSSIIQHRIVSMEYEQVERFLDIAEINENIINSLLEVSKK